MNSTPSSLVSMRRACPSIIRGREARTLTRSIPRKIGCQSTKSPFSASTFLLSDRDEPLESKRLNLSTLPTGAEFLEGLVFFRYFSRTLSLFLEDADLFLEDAAVLPDERAIRGEPSDIASPRPGSLAADSRAVAGASRAYSPLERGVAVKDSGHARRVTVLTRRSRSSRGLGFDEKPTCDPRGPESHPPSVIQTRRDKAIGEITEITECLDVELASVL